MARGTTAAAAEPQSHDQPSCVPDDEMIRSLICGLLSQDPTQLRATVARYYTPGAPLYHFLTRAASALDMYQVYRTYNFGFRSRPVIRDVIIDTKLRTLHGKTQHRDMRNTVADTAMEHRDDAEAAAALPPPPGSTSVAVWLDQHVIPKVWPLWTFELIVPTIVLLKFRPCPKTRRPLVYEQYDHVSLYGFIWSFGTLSLWLFQCLLTPAVMYIVSVAAYSLDFMEETWRFVRHQVLNLPRTNLGVLKDGGGDSRGVVCGEPRMDTGALPGRTELPGGINYATTGYGLPTGNLLGGSDLRPDAAVAIRGSSHCSATPPPPGRIPIFGTGSSDIATAAAAAAATKPLPPTPLY